MGRVRRFRRVYMEAILEARVEGASFQNVSPRGVNIGRPKFNQNVKSKQNRQVCVKL